MLNCREASSSPRRRADQGTVPIRVDGVSRIVNTSAAPGARVGTPTTGNPSSIVELEATELLLSQTIQDSQGKRVRAIPDMSNEAKNSLKGAHHRSRISCNRPRSTPRRAEVSSADGDRSLSSPLACYDRCGRGGAALRRCSRRQGRAAGCKWTPSRHQWQPWSAELQCVGVRSRSQTRTAVPDACATPKGPGSR